MPQPPNAQSIQNEGRVSLAIQAIDLRHIESERRAASTYDVPRTTIHARRAGRTARRDCEPNSKKLTKAEELVIIQHILELDSRGFSPTLSALRDMANNLLAERGASQVGKNWPENFVKRTPELKTRFNRKYDRQRALCEDPAIISPWFDLVHNVKVKYGILDADTYNFDETGFQMGVISAEVVITASDRRDRPKAV
jgi:hypothetical protein